MYLNHWLTDWPTDRLCWIQSHQDITNHTNNTQPTSPHTHTHNNRGVECWLIDRSGEAKSWCHHQISSQLNLDQSLPLSKYQQLKTSPTFNLTIIPNPFTIWPTPGDLKRHVNYRRYSSALFSKGKNLDKVLVPASNATTSAVFSRIIQFNQTKLLWEYHINIFSDTQLWYETGLLIGHTHILFYFIFQLLVKNTK